MSISKVGLGWDVGERDFANLNAWELALHNSGVFEAAHCKGGSLTQSTSLNITRGFTAGALIYGDVEYTGANEDALAFANHAIYAHVAGVIVRDIRISQAGQWVNTFEARNGASFLRCRIARLSIATTGNPTGLINTGGTADRCVISSGNTRNITLDFENPANILSCEVFGATATGAQGISHHGTNHNASNTFCFGNNIDFGSVTTPPTNCASQDTTGNFTGYTSAECVDFANKDYRIKSTSDLHALGIGAFFEPASSGGADSTIAIAWPMVAAQASQDSVAPSYDNNVAATWPAFGVSASHSAESPVYNSAVSVTWPMLSVAGLQSSAVPQYNASASAQWPIFSVTASQQQDLPVGGATIALTWPMLSVSAAQQSVAPQYSLTVTGAWPMFTVSALAGEFDYFTAPSARAVIPKLSRRATIPAQSRTTVVPSLSRRIAL